MATAYAALVSLMQIIEQMEQHPRPPISLDRSQVEFLTEKVYFLQEFLEYYSDGRHELEELESRIVDAAHEAADIIESGIVDRILAGSTSDQQNVDLFEGLQKVIDSMDSIKDEVKQKIKEARWEQAQPRADTSRPRNLQRSEQNIMVGLDEELEEIMDKLTSSNDSKCLILPIVGMGGIGKTTLARNVYSHPFILHHFDIRSWTTISQEYSTIELLRELHSQFNIMSRGDSIDKTEDELGEALYKFLIVRRYLIIMDDMWNIEAWNEVRFFFPRNDTGSRIIVTTRLSEVALLLSSSYQLRMSFLDDDKSWDLFCNILFGDKGCPLQLREAGKKITTRCKGLPLSIIVIGGLLTKSEYRQENWEHIAENLNSVLHLEDNQRCLNILYMSYNQLPVHLKPCFLYMGVFPEDEVIRVSMVIKLWVAEGFLRPIEGKSMENVAQEYMKDLIGRNLVIRDKLGSTGNIKYCSIHDLLRDLCLREAQKQRFYKLIKKPSLDIENNNVRIVISECLSPEEENLSADNLSASAKCARSLIRISGEAPSLYEFRLLRIWRTFDHKDWYEEADLNLTGNISHLVNLRYVAVTTEGGSEFCSSICLFWNLQTLIVNQVWPNSGASEIWNMPLIRHVEFTELELQDQAPPRRSVTPRKKGGKKIGFVFVPTFIKWWGKSRKTNYISKTTMRRDDDDTDQNSVVVLENLQTLSRVRNFKFSEEVVKRIPNVKKLTVFYDNLEENSDYCFDNVERLANLESFGFFFFPSGPKLFRNLTFPNSLKKLTICQFHWEEMLEKIGSLPQLEKLKLINGHMKQRTWETTEGQFCNLKFLRIEGCNIECWWTGRYHFPRLEHLVLCNLEKLKEIPSKVGDIATLESICLEFCSISSVLSARRILEEQQEFGNMDFHVRVIVKGRHRRPRGPAIPNFHVEYIPN